MRPKLSTTLFILLLAGAAMALVFQGVSAGRMPGQAQSQAAGGPAARLNEVMPKPAEGEAAWVEIYVNDTDSYMFLPVLTGGNAGVTAAGTTQPAAPFWGAVSQVDLSGWRISNEAGQVYTLPALPPLPGDSFVLVHFDGAGAGANDTDPSDGLIELHTPAGLGDVFPDLAGQAGLYQPGELSPETIVDFVAWGEASAEASENAIAAGVWGPGLAASFENGFGDISEQDILEPDESLGRYPGGPQGGVTAWANYPSGSPSPGAANPVQPVTFVTPEDGAAVDSATLALSWRDALGADAYRFQLDDNADFSSPLVDVTTPDTFYKPDPPLGAGVYHWRVNPLRSGLPTGWTPGFAIEAVSFAAPGSGPSAQAVTADVEVVLGIARVRQNKDSRLLGLDGAPEGDPTTDLPENAWDAPAPCTEPPCADNTKFQHGRQYCVRASIRMVASYYHSNPADILSMDRISYYVLQEWTGNTHPGANDTNPDNDLGFDRGMWYPDEEDEGFSWALNISYTTPGGKPTFNQIKDWIDDNRPIMFRNPGHMMVIDGYRETDGGDQFVHVLDPDQPPDFERWQDYDTQTINGYWVGPLGGPANGQSREDEASVWTDSDGDGIVNFDEVNRFGLDAFDQDSDDDWVPDKRDMREYVFDAFGNFNNRGADWDGDTVRKEMDVDNDSDGSPDGCEDTNYNGIFEAGLGETNNFSAASSQACVPHFDILYPLKTAPANAGDPNDPDKILVQVSTAVPAGWPLALTAADFSVTIGGAGANVISVYPSADTYFLVVDPPNQGAAAFYDLEVSLAGTGTDGEENAVYYLPKAPNDEVIVLDRSGSMLSDDKIGAAKNAAAAFVDYLNDGDWVGVTSFASSASTDYPLTEITGDPIRTAAITEINNLTASGTTALGQGVQEGYSLLTGAGNTDHDWSLVLLSDGWENVPPYWADVSGGITDAVVHTVALGEDADQALLQSIAGAKHGEYFFVNVDPPFAAASALEAQSVTAPMPEFPGTLPNRLADVYLSIGEIEQRLQRLFSETRYTGQAETQTFQVEIPEGVPEAIFHANWDDPAGYMTFAVFNGPDGSPVAPDAEYRSDTHVQRRVIDPEPGVWSIAIRVLKPTPELHFSVSGKSNTTLIAAVGGDPEKRGVGQPVPIYGILTDEKPIAGADVWALVSGAGIPVEPGALSAEEAAAVSGSLYLQLYDDGAHGDGKPDDGLYANEVPGDMITAPGGYAVKLAATGANNFGEPFTRYANTGFNVRPRAAYVWEDDEDTALEYEALLEDHHWLVDLVSVPAAPKADFRPYELILIGPETGYLDQWGTDEAFSAIIQSETPVLGLGEGGYAFFGWLNLNIGWGNGAHGSGTSINWANSRDEIWGVPYNIPLPKEPLQLYEKPSSRVDIYVEQAPVGVQIFGYNDTDSRYADLLLENGWFMLWSFDDGPSKMTDLGRRLFVNTAFRTVPWLP